MADSGPDAPATTADLAALRAEVKEDLATVRIEMLERIERSETTLLREFRKWAVRDDSTLRIHDARSIGYDQRLSILEERVAELEDRK